MSLSKTQIFLFFESGNYVKATRFFYLISGKMQKSNVTSFLRVVLKKFARKKVKKFAFVGLLLGAMLVCIIIWHRMQYMNYIILGIAEFMLVGVLAAGVFVLALVSEVRVSIKGVKRRRGVC